MIKIINFMFSKKNEKLRYKKVKNLILNFGPQHPAAHGVSD